MEQFNKIKINQKMERKENRKNQQQMQKAKRGREKKKTNIQREN